MLSGANVGDEVAVDGEVMLGRLAECQLRLDVEGVSRKHARVWVDGDQVWLADLESANGTKLHGTRVREVKLADGDVFALGKAKVRVRIEGDAPVVAPVMPARAPAPQPERVEPVVAQRTVAAVKPPPVASDASQASAGRGRGGALQFHRIDNKKGPLHDDVGQQGLLVRLLVFGFAIGVGVVVFWLLAR